MDKTKFLWVGLLVASIIAIGGYYYPNVGKALGSVGGVTNYNSLGISQLKVGSNCNDGFSYSGCNGTAVSGLNVGQCYIKAYATTIAASSTAVVDCQGTAAVSVGGLSTLRGVSVGDNVVVTLSTTTAGTTFLGVQLIGADASTTAGYISLTLANATGATFTWPTTGAATGTASYIATR